MAKKSQPRIRRSSPKQVGIDDEGKLDEATLRRFVFQTFGRARRTQDTPVMPDVWLRYIRVAEKIATDIDRRKSASDAVDLLLTPWSGVRPGEIAKRLRDRLAPSGIGKQTRATGQDSRLTTARIALSDSRVVVCANFETLVRHIVPLSGWWKNLFQKKRRGDEKRVDTAKQFDDAFERIEKDVKKTKKRPRGPDIELSRYAALVGFIDLLLVANSKSAIRKLAELAYRLGPPAEDPEQPHELAEKEVALLLQLYERAKRLLRPTEDSSDADSNGIYVISLNRPAAQALFESRATVKADAALRVFDIKTTGIVFAVIDGGIDATHPAFLKRSNEEVKRILKNLKNEAELTSDVCLKWSRVIETYDLTIVRDIVAHAGNPQAAEGPNSELIKLLSNKHKEAFQHLGIRNNDARDLDWEIISPLIRIPHDKLRGEDQGKRKATEYCLPGSDHGTHVAGILAADLPEDPDTGRELKGMCPELSLFDLRVFDQDGRGDEYAILCALEFVGWLNRDRANPVVHGVNLSLALAHDVDSFACGQTPICEACNHLVGAGTVVVAAAGNTGFENSGAEKQSLGTGYRAISITDPGNAEYVITVGSTHRRDPHLYGVSYFSARGPTGDGRRKPDILAPGEKITSTIRGGRSQRMDGTSMAAPHVAGAAALLMARQPELIGHPLRIKEILMQTTTDLKREPSFQGAGLVDVLRALQSV
jgi:subtilisin family serine protease